MFGEHDIETERLLTPLEVANILRLTTQTLAKWRCIGEGPKYVKIGRRVLYRRDDVLEWIEQRKRSATVETNGRRHATGRARC